MRHLIYSVAISVAFLFLNGLKATAENGQCYIKIEVKTAGEEEPIDSVSITVFELQQEQALYFTKKSGKCRIKLPTDKLFEIRFAKKNFISKTIEIDTRVPADEMADYIFFFEVSLVKESEALNLLPTNEPVVAIAYSYMKNGFETSISYTPLKKIILTDHFDFSNPLFDSDSEVKNCEDDDRMNNLDELELRALQRKISHTAKYKY